MNILRTGRAGVEAVASVDPKSDCRIFWEWDRAGVKSWPLPNVWLGVSVEDQRRADERIPLLLQTRAAVRFLSCEPLLSAVDLNAVPRRTIPVNGFPPSVGAFAQWQSSPMRAKLRDGVDWVIVGGESGPGYRPMDLDWARSLRDQCQAADVAFFMKQSSGPRPGMNAELDGQVWHQFPTVAAPEAVALTQ